MEDPIKEFQLWKQRKQETQHQIEHHEAFARMNRELLEEIEWHLARLRSQLLTQVESA